MFISLLVKMEKICIIHKLVFVHKIHFFIFRLVNRFCTGCNVVINNNPDVMKPSERIANTGKYTL